MRDVNDNMPVFTCSPYLASIPEDAQAQHSIIQLQASDRDHEAQPLRFSFSPGMTELTSVFSINPDTGWIVLLTQLDRERQDLYNLTVTVSDTSASAAHKSGDGTSMTSSTSVLLTVTDCNDNPPKFDQDSYSTSINEGALPGTVLVKLGSKDADTGSNAVVTYYITDGDQLGQFEVSHVDIKCTSSWVQQAEIGKQRELTNS